MINEVDFILQQENEEQKTTDEMDFRLSHNELTQLLATIKNDIRACILDLECPERAKEPLIHSMNNLMGEVVRAGKLVHQLKKLTQKANCLIYNLKDTEHDQ